MNIKDLAKFLNSGEKFARDRINELIEYGYAKRELVRKEAGRFAEWITKFFERPNLDEQSIVTSWHFTTSRPTTSRQTPHIEIKDQTNSGSEKENIKTPLIPPKLEPEKEGVQKIEPPEPEPEPEEIETFEPEPEIKSKGLTPLFAEGLAKVYGKAGDYLKGIRSAAPTVGKPKKRSEQATAKDSSNSEPQFESFPQALEAIDPKYLKRVLAFGIQFDDQVIAAIKEFGERRLAVCLNAMDQAGDTIRHKRSFFLAKLPKCEAEVLGSRLPVFTASAEEIDWFSNAPARVAAKQAELAQRSEPATLDREAEMERRRQQAEQLRREIEAESEDAF